MVERWLDDLLPSDADELCRNRVHVLVRVLVLSALYSCVHHLVLSLCARQHNVWPAHLITASAEKMTAERWPSVALKQHTVLATFDHVLPASWTRLCKMMTVWPWPGRRQAITDFTSKEDLIKACMASVHVPWFMNKRFSARFRGRR